ncbi:MAG: diguanylate cyclase [Deltaproteobacteria bacterium]|nr:diguanylate cyclase [Deltaproteobacteria bacterium]
MKKVLIIDDDNLTGAMVETILRAHAYQTRRAHDGPGGVEAARQWQPDLVLLDIVMPGMEGPKVCEAIRGMKLPSRPSIVITSSRGEKKIIVDALLRGADDFIVKPVDEVELLARIKAQLRIVDFFREIEENNRNLETILAVTEAVSGTLDTMEILGIIVKKVAGIVGAVRCSIVLIRDGREGYVLASHEDPNVRNLKIDLARYPEIREVMRTKTHLALDDMINHPLMSGVKEFIKDLDYMSLLVIPIVFNEEVLGTLFLRARRRESGFTKKEINFCQIIANASYQALKNARLFEHVAREKDRLSEIAVRDPLTSLYNHNFFYTRLEEEFERAMRYGSPLSLIMMDVDDFKRINDTYGHRTGDTVLKDVASLIQRSVRKSDIVARYGGEEFAVILPQTSLDGAVEEADRIRKVVSGHGCSGLKEEKIAVSSGVSSYPDKTVTNAGMLVNFADRALYEAKKSGKNCVKRYIA